MADVLRIKRRALGGAAGAPASLAVGELAFNEVDGGLYIGRSNASVVQVNAGGGGNVSNVGTPVNGQLARWTGATTIQGVAPETAGASRTLLATLNPTTATAEFNFTTYSGAGYDRLEFVISSFNLTGILQAQVAPPNHTYFTGAGYYHYAYTYSSASGSGGAVSGGAGTALQLAASACGAGVSIQGTVQLMRPWDTNTQQFDFRMGGQDPASGYCWAFDGHGACAGFGGALGYIRFNFSDASNFVAPSFIKMYGIK